MKISNFKLPSTPRKHRFFFIISMFIILLPLLYIVTKFAPGSYATWFDDSFAYRQKITIGNTGAADSNKKVKLDIDTDTLTTDKMQADCDDSRFTDINGKVLKFFLDSAGGACDGASTDYYVLVPTINTGDTILYFYYGNPQAVNGGQAAQFSEGTFTPTSGPTFASEEKTPSPAMYLRFEDAQGTTAQDSSPNNNDGSVSGAIWTEEGLCLTGRCLSFDGSDDVVTVTNVSSIDLDGGLASAFSISTWFKANSDGEGDVGQIAQKGTNTYLRVDSQSGSNLDVEASLDLATTDATVNVSAPITVHTWNHVTLVYTDDGDDEIEVYINGILRGTSTNGSGAPAADTNNLLIGGVTTANFAGYIDEFKIYPFARTAAQVAADFTRASSTKGGGVLGAQDSRVISGSLLGWWRLDEDSGDAADSTPNATTLTNINTTAYDGAKFGHGADHESGSSNYFLAADSTILSQTGSITLSSWIKPESTTADTQFDIAGKFDGSNESYLLAQYADEIRFYVDSSSNYVATSSVDLTTGVWYSVIAVYDSLTATARIYVNGSLATTTTTGTIPSSIGDDAGRFHIGAEDSTTTAANFYDGIIDEVRLYGRAFTGSEVPQLYRFGTGPVAWWKMDENTGTTTADYSGYGNTSSTFTNDVAWARGKYNSGLSFDGTNDVVRVVESSELDVGLLNDSYTVTAWIKVNSTNLSADADIVAKHDGTGTFPFSLAIDSTSADNIVFGNAVGTNASVASPADLEWHFVAGRRDVETDLLTIFLDGYDSSTTTDPATGSQKNNDDVSIGNGGTSYTALDFPGVIDDVRIYNYARTQEQLVEDMSGGQNRERMLWHLDEMQGTSAKSSGPSTRALTLSAASWTSSGKFGGAWNGQGARWLTIANTGINNIVATDNASMTFWLKSDSATNPSATEYIQRKGSNTQAGYGVYVNTDGTICFGIDDDTTWDPDVASCTTADFYDATWHHVAVVRDHTFTDKTYIYVDGILRDSDIDTTTGSLTNTTAFRVGDRNAVDDGDELFGDLDEFTYCECALSAEEVRQEYNQHSGVSLGAASTASDGLTADSSLARAYCVPGDTATCAAPVGHWNLDERTGTAAVDISSNANSLTLTSGPLWTQGRFGPGVDFDGSDDHLLRADDADFDFAAGGSFTLEAWFRHTTQSSGQDILISKYAAAGYKVLMEADGDITCGIDYDSTWTPTDSVTSTVATYDDDAWHHMACVKNANTSLTLYIDGISVGTPDTALTNSTLANADPLYIGIDADASSNPWLGQVDEIRIFNDDRTAAQVVWDYNHGAAFAQYKFDECQGSTAYASPWGANYDSSLNGTITIGASGDEATVGDCTTSSTSWGNGATGKFNASLDLDGTDDYVSVTDTANLRFDEATRDFSLFAWVKRSTTGTEYIISKEDADNDGYRLQFNSSNQVLCSEDATDVTSTGTVTDTNWHHVGCTIDRDGNGQTYIDGRADGAAVSMGTDAMATTANITIGTRAYTATSYLNGQVDDARIFNYALTAAQVKNVMNDGAVRFGPNTGAP